MDDLIAEMRELPNLLFVKMLENSIAGDEKQIEELDRVTTGLETDIQLCTNANDKRILERDLGNFSRQKKMREEIKQNSIDFLTDLLSRKPLS
ncbi:hypothetical protein [Tunturiibacter gelidiferens]|uniref:hypothetical protein n=1 Tax=Tunturiibacter gelidiferens TaxID=3069689 RepID=UPI003D9AF561